MNIEITPSKISGSIRAPSSKSLSHRAIIVAALARGTSTLHNVLSSNDIEQTMEALKRLGVSITKQGASLFIVGSGGKLKASTGPIHLGESGSTLRFLTAVSGLAAGKTILTGGKRLCERPIADIIAPLAQMGIKVNSIRHDNHAPLEIIGGEKILGGDISVEAGISSQFVSAILFISPFATDKTIIRPTNSRSKPYTKLTLDVMRDFGIHIIQDDSGICVIAPKQTYEARAYTIEGDYSSSSYFFAGAAITSSSVTVTNLNPHTSQGDIFFLTLLKKMGCTFRSLNGETTITPPKKLHAITVDLSDCPDIVQSLAVVATFAKGTTHITNIAHLKHKETDRLHAVTRELRKMGAQIDQNDNSLTITGGRQLKGACVDTHNDHRMAMSFAVAGLKATGITTIQNAEVVHKSYPHFFQDLASLGASVKERI